MLRLVGFSLLACVRNNFLNFNVLAAFSSDSGRVEILAQPAIVFRQRTLLDAGVTFALLENPSQAENAAPNNTNRFSTLLSPSLHRLQFPGSSSTIDLYGDVSPGARLKLNRFYCYSMHLTCVWRVLVAQRATQRISQPLIDRWMDRSNCNCQSVERRTRQRQRENNKSQSTTDAAHSYWPPM